jgi:ABC-2 type transport system ATP-binding protein
VTAAPAIDVERLHVVRGGKTVLDDLDVQVHAGRVTGLLGPSGSGKSTLLRSIVGVQRIASGSVRVLGLPAGAPELRRRVAYTTQEPSVYADLTVRENLRYFGRLLGVAEPELDRSIQAVRLGDNADAVVARLSGGQKARASLATALLGRPEVLILDEPTVGLDPLLRRDLWSIFRSLAADGATLVVSSHVMDEAENCDELVLVREGAIVAYASPQAIRERTGTDDMSEAFIRLIEEQDG